MNPMMIKKIQKMQQDMEKEQARVTQSEFCEEYQGIVVEMLGTREIARIQIDPDLLNPSDKDILEELLQVAINNCIKKIEKAFEDALKPFASLTGAFGF